MPEPKRSARVSGRLREELARLLRLEAKDPRVAPVLVSRVEMPDDLSFARVFYRLDPVTLGTTDIDERTIKRAQDGLRAATGMLRAKIARALALRTAPELRFEYDRSLEAENRVEALLREIEEEKHKPLSDKPALTSSMATGA